MKLAFRIRLLNLGRGVLTSVMAKRPLPWTCLDTMAELYLSYVAQFAAPPANLKVNTKEYYAPHELLRLPPKSLPHALLHSLQLFSIVEPFTH